MVTRNLKFYGLVLIGATLIPSVAFGDSVVHGFLGGWTTSAPKSKKKKAAHGRMKRHPSSKPAAAAAAPATVAPAVTQPIARVQQPVDPVTPRTPDYAGKTLDETDLKQISQYFPIKLEITNDSKLSFKGRIPEDVDLSVETSLQNAYVPKDGKVEQVLAARFVDRKGDAVQKLMSHAPCSATVPCKSISETNSIDLPKDLGAMDSRVRIGIVTVNPNLEKNDPTNPMFRDWAPSKPQSYASPSVLAEEALVREKAADFADLKNCRAASTYDDFSKQLAAVADLKNLGVYSDDNANAVQKQLNRNIPVLIDRELHSAHSPEALDQVHEQILSSLDDLNNTENPDQAMMTKLLIEEEDVQKLRTHRQDRQHPVTQDDFEAAKTQLADFQSRFPYDQTQVQNQLQHDIDGVNRDQAVFLAGVARKDMQNENSLEDGSADQAVSDANNAYQDASGPLQEAVANACQQQPYATQQAQMQAAARCQRAQTNLRNFMLEFNGQRPMTQQTPGMAGQQGQGQQTQPWAMAPQQQPWNAWQQPQMNYGGYNPYAQYAMAPQQQMNYGYQYGGMGGAPVTMF